MEETSITESDRRPTLLDLGSLLAAPLVGLVEADFQAALRSCELIETFGFTGPEAEPRVGDRHLGRPRMVTFVHPAPGIVGTPEIVEIPAVTLVPLPLLQMAEAELEMSLRLFGPSPWEPDPGRTDRPTVERWAAVFTPHTKGKSPRRPPFQQPNLTLKLKVREADLPSGAAHLLQILGPISSPIPTSAPPGASIPDFPSSSSEGDTP